MNSPIQSTHLTLEPNDTRRLASLCGRYDEHLRQIESRLGVSIKNRGNQFQIDGHAGDIARARALVTALYGETAGRRELSPEGIHLQLQEAGMDEMLNGEQIKDGGQSTAADATERDCIQTRRKLVRPRGKNQQRYIEAIRANDISFGIGPAGTGKTWLAVACAVEALEQHRVERILLVRPAVEAGEKLGFLPGDLTQKVDPYLRPLYDALYEMVGFEKVSKLIEKNVIEVAPLAYMRGRTLNNSFVILDESQNTTREQMKMFLTRIGFGSTAVITGDITQVDLPKGTLSGLVHAMKVLDGVKDIGFTHFSAKDVVRHPLVQHIVRAYDRFEKVEQAQDQVRRQSRDNVRDNRDNN